MVSAASKSSTSNNNELIISKESLPNCIRKISIVYEETDGGNDTRMSDIDISNCNLESPLRRRTNKVKQISAEIMQDTPQFKITE